MVGLKRAAVVHIANEDEGLKTAFIEADKYQWTKEEIIAYDNVTIKEADEVQEKLKVAEKAREEGVVEGMDSKEAEMVIKLYRKGKTDIEIADLLDIPIQRGQQIIKKHFELGK